MRFNQTFGKQKMNTFGKLFRVTTFGESHGAALGCVVDGCPAGVPVDEKLLQAQLERRRPGQSAITAGRNEPDIPEILSGIFEGKTLGTPIAMLVKNRDVRSSDYNEIRNAPRPGHADTTWKVKFGHVDYRGGGRSSGRETVSRVMAGWVAESVLTHVFADLHIVAWVSMVGDVAMDKKLMFGSWSREEVDAFSCRCPDRSAAEKIERMLLEAKEKGESYGGVVSIKVTGMPKGLGEPVFLKLQSHLAAALSSIGTVNGLWWNQRPIELSGSEFHKPGNTYNGTIGGISNGEDLLWHIACKPISTLGEQARKGRHDPCVLPRIVPVVESMTALVLIDLYLLDRARRGLGT